MGATYNEELRRYVADCESHADHDGVPASHHHDLTLRHELDPMRPVEVTVWAIYQGGFKRLQTWPWNADGAAAAQAWCDEHRAEWRTTRFPVQTGDLIRHETWSR